MPRFDAEVWFRFSSESISTAGVDLQRLKAAAEGAGFELKGGKVTAGPPGEGKEGWGEKREGRTWYVPLDPEREE
jgi:hypothetical protein